jgi:signal transduction histidine kinase
MRGLLILFLFGTVFGLITILLFSGFGILAYFLNLGVPIPHPRERGPFVFFCIGSASLPFLALLLAGWAQRRIAKPLADILEVTESVAEGNLGARVPENKKGPFRLLERTFNRMMDELQRADEQRRNLTADVAHELNTPLHIIQGYLEGILDGVYQPDKGTIAMLLEETSLLSRLIEDLRTLSLAEAGELPLHLEQVKLQEFFEDLQTSFSGQVEAAELKLFIDVQEGITVNADPDRLDQIFSNLVANALRYTNKGGVIQVRAERKEDGVLMQVIDSGEGIPSTDLPFIFNRFWRKEKSRGRESGGGHGLGLAIVQKLVESHGGKIEVDSEVDKGTIFSIRLPDPLPNE